MNQQSRQGTILEINGPIVTVRLPGVHNGEQVRIGRLGLYGEVEVICTSTCAVVAPASQAQWSCFQGVPDDASCAALAGCNATNCP